MTYPGLLKKRLNNSQVKIFSSTLTRSSAFASATQFPYQQAEKATDILLRLINTKGADENIPQKIVLESKVVINYKDN
jgi:hypothetical protein